MTKIFNLISLLFFRFLNKPSNPEEKIDEEDEKDENLRAEFTALRAEIVQRLQIQIQLILATLTALAAILTVGVQSGNYVVILLYPILTTLLTLVSIENDFWIGRLGSYIRRNERRLFGEGLGWENFHKIGSRSFRLYSGVYMGTPIFAVLVFLILSGFDLPENIQLFVGIDFLAILLNIYLLTRQTE